MSASDPSSTPLSDEAIHIAFLKDLDAATDREQVIRDYAARYPGQHLADALRETGLDCSASSSSQRPVKSLAPSNPRNGVTSGSSV